MKFFGRKSAGREALRPALSRGFGAWSGGDFPRSYEAQVREGYIGNPIAQRAMRLVAESVASAPLLASDPGVLALVQARSAGQAQKEMTHNEAMTLLDIAVQPVVQAVAPASVPSSPAPGQCWIVGAAPSGAWAGYPGALAGWTSGGWRFVAPVEGMTVWSIADSTVVRRAASTWVTGQLTAVTLSIGAQQVIGARLAHIPAPTGGTVADIESRAAVSAILAAMRTHGLISSS